MRYLLYHLQALRSSKWFIYIVIDLAVFTDAYLYGLIIPVLPFALTEYIHIPPADVQKWIGILVGAYGGGLLVGSPVAGYLADNSKSRRPVYMLGLLALTASTVLFAFGRSATVLIIARVFQGASSGFVHSIGNAILADVVGEDGIGPAMGWITLMIALGMVTGPVCGGIIYHHAGYMAVFISAFAILGIDFVFRILMVDPKENAAPPDDEWNERISDRNTKPPMYGTLSDTSESQSPQPVSPSSSSGETSFQSSPATSNTSTTLQEATPLLAPQPLTSRSTIRLPIFFELLTMPRILVSILGAFMMSFILTEIESILPLYTKHLFHYNSKDVGLVFLLLLVPSFGSPVLGSITDKYGVKLIATLGFLLLAPFWILLRLINTYNTANVAGLCVLLFFIGVGVDMVLTPSFIETKDAVDERAEQEPGVFGEKGAYAQAYAQMNMAYASGSLLGPLVGSLLVEEIGWGNVTLLTGILCAVCVGPSVYFLGGRGRKKGKGVVNGDAYG